MMKKLVLTIVMGCIASIASANNMLSPIKVDTVLTDGNVTYKVISDENNVYINLSTADQKTMMSMLRLGVTVYFDIKGKKKKNVFVKYPLETVQRERQQGRPQRTDRTDRSDRTERPEATSIEEELIKKNKRILGILENNYSQSAEYAYFDDTQEFHVLMNNLNIVPEFTYHEEEGVLEYNLTLPKTRINSNPNKGLSHLTIGVKTEKPDRDGNNGSGVNGNLGGFSLGGQGGGRGQEGPPGGGGQGGGRRGQGGGGQRGGSQNGNERPTDVLLNFWFEANLNQ